MTTRRSLENKGLPIVTCECGTEILMIPDAAALGKAIEAHGNLHGSKKGSQKEIEEESSRIQEILIKKIFRALKKQFADIG